MRLESLEPRCVLDSTVVFNELMYHPAASEESLEWIELYNQQAVDMDISGWRLRGGIDFTFGPNTILGGGDYLVVAISPTALQAATGLATAIGPFSGRLANTGERLELVNNSDRLMDAVEYGDDGDWPVAPDGSGLTLAKRDPDTGSADPASWTSSTQIGGTPGARNFPSTAPQIQETTILPMTHNQWRYNQSGANLGTSWREADYDDSGWAVDDALFYVTAFNLPAPKNTLLNLNADGVAPNTITFYFRTTFDFAGDLGAVGLKLKSIIDDGAVFYLNGAEVYRQNMLPGAVNFDTTASPAVGNPLLTGPFSLSTSNLHLGTNTFAVEVHQSSAGSNDVVFGAELTLSETIVYQPPSVPTAAINEVSGGNSSGQGFAVELYNHGTAPLDLTGFVLSRAGATVTDYVFPGQTLGPGQYLALTAAQLGFTATDGEKLFLYAPGKSQVIDAVVVKPTPRGRLPAGTGSWFYPDQTTFGSTNSFVFHDEIVINEIMYHHRPTPDRPGTYVETSIFPIDTAWKYDDSGVDRGIGWRTASYDDSGWASGAALLYLETATLPATKNTPLTPGRSTYYFRKSFTFAGDPTSVQLSLNPIVDDGAVFYLNGVEIQRLNMPAGDIEFGTSASGVVDNAAYSGPIVLPATGLVNGMNVLAVEVHQATAAVGGGPSIAPQPGYQIAWDGSNGDFFTSANPALAPDNPALASHGVTPFGSSQYGAGIHLITNINDGRYGNSNSWLANFPVGDPNPYIGLRFNQTLDITSIAWGRDNGNTVADGCGGTCADRSLGVYTIQVTNVAAPGTTTAETADPATGWKTIGTLTYGGSGPGFTPHLRHRYTLAQNGAPIQATGLRIKVSDDDLAIDEIEINAAQDPGNADIVFGASLATVVEISPPTTFSQNDEEWIELYNRGAATVDLTGWRLDEGIDFNFPAGTTIPVAGYLVVAKNKVAIQSQYPSIAVVGDYSGSLANDTDRIVLKDPRNNPADDVRYFDGGRWPGYADGGGSSLELRDPDADNSQPEAWAASDESTKSQWRTFSYRGVAAAEFPPARWNEFVMGLFGDGEMLIDDISVVESPGGAATQKLINGNFESDTIGAPPASWRINGNHRTSRVVADPDNPGQKVLYLISSGRTNDRFNHAETTFIGDQPATNGLEYEISFRAKWLAGTDQLNTRLYFNRLARRTTLDVPQLSGTPGMPNSRAIPNAAPTHQDLRHAPVVPGVNEAVTVSVIATDPDGVGAITLHYSVNGGAFAAVTMTHLGGGRYTGTIPGQAASAIVQFYIEGTDTLGAVSTFPAAGAASRALYEVQDNQAQPAGKHSLRIIMTAADTTFMHDPANVLSNEDYRATVLYDESQVFYNVGASLKGSMAARPNSTYVGFHIHFDPAQKFRGVHEDISIDRSGRGALVTNGQEEILIKQMMLAAGDIPSMYDDLVYVVAPRTTENGPALLMMAEYGDVYLDSQYDDGGDGTVYNFDLIYYQNNTTNGLPDGPKTPIGYGHPSYNVDLEYLGDDEEKYRWHFRIETSRARDDYTRLTEFLGAMSLVGSQSGGPLDLATRDLMDVNEWMRLFAAQSLAGAGPDLYGRGLPHNLRLYVRPDDDRVLAFPWDWDLSAFGLATNADIFPSGNIRKVIDIPANKRLYYSHLHELLNTKFNRSYLSYWTAHYSSLLPGQNFSGALTYLDSRTAFVASQLPASVPFSASTGDVVNSTTLLSSGAAARALVPSLANGGDLLGAAWTQVGFDDAGWTNGTTGVGYERDTGYQSLLGLDVLSAIDTNSDGLNENNTVFVRTPFTIVPGAAFDQLKLRVKYDDGFVAYLNGVKVAEANAPASLAWNSEATAVHDDTAAVVFAEFDVSQYKSLLQTGTNVLAIQALNRGAGSSDMLLVPELVGETVQGGADSVVTDQPTITIGGSAWINVREIRVQGQTTPLVLSWPTVSSWQATIPVPFGTHTLTLEAYDYRGVIVGSDTFTVTCTFSDRPLEDYLRISELMYHPADPTPAEIAAGFTDADDFEYAELYNLSTTRTLDLTGVKFTDGITFDFTSSAVISLAPGELVVIVENAAAFAPRYGSSGARVAGQYAGRLNNAGEHVTLVDGNGTLLQEFAYADTWYPATDGLGQSLVPRSLSANKAEWDLATGWRPSIDPTGSPGQKDSLLGDLDGDNQVGLSDIHIMQSRLQLLTTAGAGGGDLNRDGAITRADLAILTMNYGQTYSPPPPPAAPSAPQAVVVGDTPQAVTAASRALAATRSRPQKLAAIDQVFDDTASRIGPSRNTVLRASRSVRQTAK